MVGEVIAAQARALIASAGKEVKTPHLSSEVVALAHYVPLQVSDHLRMTERKALGQLPPYVLIIVLSFRSCGLV